MKTKSIESKRPQAITHTPGPWILKNHGINEPEYGHGIVHSFGGAHRFVQIENVGILETVDMDIPKLEANARLIAAAPDLLDALEELRCQARCGNPDSRACQQEFDAATKKADAAIQKAKTK